jgi:uncharacterized phiE125 gp8 family phage protein
MAMSPGYGDKLITPPTWEPVSIAEVVNLLRIAGPDIDNGVVADCITDAREYVETVARRAIPQQQWELTFDQFPGRQVDDYRPPTWRYGIVRFPRPPLISVDKVEYVDPGQSTQPFVYTTLATDQYQTDTRTEPGRLAPAPFVVWPATNPLAMAGVRITFTAGYTQSSLVPGRLKRAIKMLAGHLYEHREATTEVAISRIPAGLAAFISSAATWEYA